ncbi:MAG: hypothetical protein QGF20_08615, partial [Alphaproteobacteria bacterium]|nr:hypothetical protein [Alphaproteobacteria bacterium]
SDIACSANVMVIPLTSLDRRRFSFRRHLKAEVRADLIAAHAAETILFVLYVNREPAKFIGHLAPGENFGRTNADAESAGLAIFLAEVDIPDTGILRDLGFLGLEERHCPSFHPRYTSASGAPTMPRPQMHGLSRQT